MNKSDLIDAMAESAGITKAAAKKALIHFHQLNQDQIFEEDDLMY